MRETVYADREREKREIYIHPTQKVIMSSGGYYEGKLSMCQPAAAYTALTLPLITGHYSHLG